MQPPRPYRPSSPIRDVVAMVALAATLIWAGSTLADDGLSAFIQGGDRPVASEDAIETWAESSGQGVTATIGSDPSIHSQGTILSEVIVDPMAPACVDCELANDSSWIGEQDGSICGASGCQHCNGEAYSAVRDELAERRAINHCRGFHPRLRVRASAVFMDRVTENFRVLIDSTASPIRQLNAEKFDFDWEPGIDISASQVAWDDSEFEFRFLGLREFSATQHVDTQGSDVRFDANPDIFAPNVQTIDARYTSDLYGFELNWHYVTYLPFNYIAGFRYVALDDDLTAVLDAVPQTFVYKTSTRNDLYGLQLGVTSVPEMPLFGWHCLSWFAKAGIYGNDTSQRTVLDTSTLGQIVSESPDTSAVLWEFGLGLDLPITDCVSIQGGYSAMIFERISIASDQLRHIDFLNATGSTNKGTAMFHGANLAIVLRH